MSLNKPYYLLLIPLLLSFFAIAGYGFFFKAAVPGSCIFILLLPFGRRHQKHSDTWFVVAAFLFSIAGDWFLSNKGDHFMMFSTGIGLYLFAHIGYLWFALRNGRIHRLFTIVVLAAYLLFFLMKLYPALNEPILLFAVLLYLVISCISLGAAFGIELIPLIKWTYFGGVSLILLSDTMIALNEFASYNALNFLILPTYYAAQMIITFALIRRF